ncbi:hypothetical protein B4166_3436 [Caldibacillus thermoamylovorans]|uniref:Uncharacterized protein n=1 Tax=Caldibacillus thermoamylovorans TaxID=35841 RepID=A0ABD4A726_9BACI|nr:hypothetical protein B4166_3436 [Caldibacillus thermoamylovorans]KIO72559.1 hypothetical protein B4167_2972 [Caldibacillus thermoamylovorans]
MKTLYFQVALIYEKGGMFNMKLEGKVAVVTGAASGMRKAIAQVLQKKVQR